MPSASSPASRSASCSRECALCRRASKRCERDAADRMPDGKRGRRATRRKRCTPSLGTFGDHAARRRDFLRRQRRSQSSIPRLASRRCRRAAAPASARRRRPPARRFRRAVRTPPPPGASKTRSSRSSAGSPKATCRSRSACSCCSPASPRCSSTHPTRAGCTLPIEFRLAAVAAAAIGALAFGWRERGRRRAFGLSLQGGAIGVLLMTVFAAFRLYSSAAGRRPRSH